MDGMSSDDVFVSFLLLFRLRFALKVCIGTSKPMHPIPLRRSSAKSIASSKVCRKRPQNWRRKWLRSLEAY